MRLRENLKNTSDDDFDLGVTTGRAAGDGGVAHGALLVDFSEAALGADPARLSQARDAVRNALGTAGLADAAAVIAAFNAIDRVADATGIPLEDWKRAMSEDFRENLGVEAFKRH